MGGWLLEVGKMTMYMSFPVILFHYFNQPEFYEEWVTSTRRAIYPPENLGHREELEKCKKALQEKREKELFSLIEQEKNKRANLS
jgi:protein PET100, animal type